MPNTEHFRKLERMYADAPCNEYYEPELSIEEGKATLTMPVKEDQFHAANAVHGSSYFKALDDAAFFAVNSLVSDVFVLTSQFNLYLTRPITEGWMEAVGEVVHESGSQFIADAVVRDSDGNVIARGTGNFIKSRIKLDEDVGYR
ncbi:PaaI family thioesterase [Haladaptatus sp. DJG-WS-42]|uniref:PaaI family thioesterase n=1 Tax=Haladaptatus sp. DJG-WS-42 TaxID=3120516 RepID=UPI0030D6230A